MANIQQSPSLSAKLKTRDAANRIKHGSPKLQEVLRQRCRQRMREKRGQLFNRRRQGFMETDEEVHEALTEIVRQELSQLATLDDDSKKLLGLEPNEPMTQDEALALEFEFWAQEDQWMLQEFEMIQKAEDEMLAWYAEDGLKENVVCPLCEKGVITEVLDFLVCPACNLRLPLRVSVEDFGKMIKDSVAMHSSRCSGRPGFMLLPENDTVSLYLTCETCSIFSVIV